MVFIKNTARIDENREKFWKPLS